jgi:hypothetical protein
MGVCYTNGECLELASMNTSAAASGSLAFAELLSACNRKFAEISGDREGSR